MPTVQEQLVTLLSPLLAGGLHPMMAPQGVTFPYGVYQRISSAPENTLGGNGSPPIGNTRMQVDVWALTYADAQATAQAIKSAMQAWALQNVLALERDDYEVDVRLYRVVMDFSIWHY